VQLVLTILSDTPLTFAKAQPAVPAKPVVVAAVTDEYNSGLFGGPRAFAGVCLRHYDAKFSG